MSHQESHTDNGYLNDFHREWDERCMKENARVLSMRFSHEYAKAQSERMNALVQLEEERKYRRKES